MLRDERRRPAWRGALPLALCGLACGIACAMMIVEWRAAIAPAKPAATASGPRGRASLPAAAAAPPPTAVFVDTTATERPLAPPAHRSRHHRGDRAPAELAAVPLESLATRLAAELGAIKPQLDACMRAAREDGANAGAEASAALRAVRASALAAEGASLSGAQEALLRDLEAAASAASHAAAPRSLRLDVETGDGEVRIVGVPAQNDDSAFFLCAEKELSGLTVPSPGATAGGRVSVVLPL